ncbi:SDR family NAD(P)-dependent oxidoreductase [Paeniglutamicibacter antarcticus]|uniref:SDR family NAD(P)-dependent oxidoreductase n=1 Tax=Arthrobacter terrae TaxID=2935737 RepID=A0A931CIM4_9MICC|nr:SDR family NAD(P)-dependent oxidoreductase [Arthrobacter terrae]MBG0739008.1 SDR family NAD(P)-dependent oxidoreductase [Arthrobacter terrae]
MTIALITGASSGLGAEFARQLAARGYDLVLVARDTARLEQRATEITAAYGVKVEILTADLLTDEGTAAVTARLGAEQNPVTVLVNNAGFGLKGWFTDNTLEDERAQLRILVQVPMELSYAAISAMQRRGSGRIINVASTAGFTTRGTYSAAKAWVINFSRWANTHYGPRNIPVTAVCPGFVRTEFHGRMGADTTGISNWMWLDAERVVREGLGDAFAGKAVSIPSKRYKVLSAITANLPDALATRLSARGR